MENASQTRIVVMPVTRTTRMSLSPRIGPVRAPAPRLGRPAQALQHGTSSTVTTAPRFSRILVALDGSPASQFVVDWAKHIAIVHRSRVWVVSVVHPEVRIGHDEPGLAALGRRAYEADLAAATVTASLAADTFRRAHIRVEEHVVEGRPERALLQLADDFEADLVVVGSHSRPGLERFFVGSVSDHVMRRADASVLIAKGRFERGAVLVPQDHTASGKAAADVACRLAAELRTRCDVLDVAPTARPGALRFGGSDGFATSEARPRARSVRTGHVAREVVDEVDEGYYGLVVFGVRPPNGAKRTFLGTLAKKVAHKSEASVLIVRP